MAQVYGADALPLCGEPALAAVETFDCASYLGVGCAKLLAQSAMLATLSLEDVPEALEWAASRGADR